VKYDLLNTPAGRASRGHAMTRTRVSTPPVIQVHLMARFRAALSVCRVEEMWQAGNEELGVWLRDRVGQGSQVEWCYPSNKKCVTFLLSKK
jgi:hypothetical protein